MTNNDFKQLRRYHDPGDIHELTFSTYQQKKLLTNNAWRAKLSECIDDARESIGCRLAAFVFMPDHVHLLIWGIESKEQVGDFLGMLKQPLSVSVHTDLRRSKSRLLNSLLVQERPGKQVFRYWQEGAGYDRNLKSIEATSNSLNYIHQNPVVAGLCKRAGDWRWSSARYYECDGMTVDPLHPQIHPLPREFWLGGWRI